MHNERQNAFLLTRTLGDIKRLSHPSQVSQTGFNWTEAGTVHWNSRCLPLSKKEMTKTAHLFRTKNATFHWIEPFLSGCGGSKLWRPK